MSWWRLEVIEDIRASELAQPDDNSLANDSFCELVPRKNENGDRYLVIDRQGNTIEISTTDGSLLDGDYVDDNLKRNELADYAILSLDDLFNNEDK